MKTLCETCKHEKVRKFLKLSGETKVFVDGWGQRWKGQTCSLCVRKKNKRERVERIPLWLRQWRKRRGAV